jgi:hypothetical protein
VLLGLAIEAASAQSPGGAFASTGSMNLPRFAHSAILLQNGQVLIAGGFSTCDLGSPCAQVNTAELYDPIAGVFTLTGSMSSIAPTKGVLLPSGQVLFAEGYTGTLARVEVYDPAAGVFSVVGNTATLSSVGNATLLNDGTVLLTGVIFPTSISGAEIYDPIAGTFTPVTTWPSRIGFVSSLAVLGDGRVLLDSPALYDPLASTFSSVPTRGWFNDAPPSALLPNGQVLLTGGNTDGGDVNWSELFDPSTGSFTRSGDMLTARDSHTATVLAEGTVLIAGGGSYNNGTLASTSSTESYDSTTGQFSPAGSMTTPRASHAAVLLNNGQVLITGGNISIPAEGTNRTFTGTSSAELYTPPAPPGPSIDQTAQFSKRQ